MLAPTERRRAPDTVVVALEVSKQACDSAGRSPTELRSVFASTHGDLAISDYMCATLVDTPTLLSPVKFHNSVHNAAGGYWTMATGTFAPYTALSGYHQTFGTGLLEALTQVAGEQQSVLYVAFDIEAKGPLATMAPSQGVLGAALVLTPERPANPKAELRIEVVSDTLPLTAASSAAAALVHGNAMESCLPLMEALARDGASDVTVGLSRYTALRIRVTPA
jgi:hypothetical protein